MNPEPARPFASGRGGLGPGATRGDPLFDFATLLSYWVHEDDPPALHDMAQMPAERKAGFWAAREQAGGEATRAVERDATMSDFLFHRVLAMYKLGVIFLQAWLSLAERRPRPSRAMRELTAIGTGQS